MAQSPQGMPPNPFQVPEKGFTSFTHSLAHYFCRELHSVTFKKVKCDVKKCDFYKVFKRDNTTSGNCPEAADVQSIYFFLILFFW